MKANEIVSDIRKSKQENLALITKIILQTKNGKGIMCFDATPFEYYNIKIEFIKLYLN